MSNTFLSPQPLWQRNGLGTLRIITGLLMIYHGWEVFDNNKMTEYMKWDVIKSLPAPVFMAYLGKALELLSGILFVLGLFTRIAASFMAITMLVICFKIGNGKFYYEDQNPFLFAMLALMFFFTGPVKWSIDQLIFKTRNNNRFY
ncbi:MAG: DoxX family protein [Ferruginibacter sp.]